MGKRKKNSVAKMKKMEEKVQNQRKITRKLNKIKEEEDQISALEDCLLLEILSRLPSTKEAIRTGSLSKRWQHLWTEVPTLVFQYHNTAYSPWDLFRFIENPVAEFKFFSFVEKTLTQCRQLKLKRFEMVSSYNIGFRSQVSDWVHYAIKCNVEELNLVLWNKRLKVKFELDQLFFSTSCFTHLSLEGCILNPTGAINWNNLVYLCLIREKLEGLIENMLSGSPLMETLIMYRCYGFTRLDITSKEC
ncbi:F-box/LRR-repeat protein 25-like protein [Tanacetum coccineum]